MTDFIADTCGRIYRPRLFNISCRKVGGIRFLKIGRITVSWSISKAYRPL